MKNTLCEIELYGHVFQVFDPQGEAHVRQAVAALQRRVQAIQDETRTMSPFRVALMAALSAEAELLSATAHTSTPPSPVLSFRSA